VLACPLTDITDQLIDSEALPQLPTHATLINVARGEVVDTGALIKTPQTNEIQRAPLDLTDPELLPGEYALWDPLNCHITPHNAGHTPQH
jgi:Phosphoglycerate dehydrogenase and related dehydrogenases